MTGQGYPDDPLNKEPFIGQIVQATMTLSSGGAVLPPLLASADARRESGRVVAPVPWNPDPKKQKRNHILRYPNCLYAVLQSSLQSRKHELPVFRINDLPAFQLAQYKYLPANCIVEIKLDNLKANQLAAEHYTALLSAYLLHERLLFQLDHKKQKH